MKQSDRLQGDRASVHDSSQKVAVYDAMGSDRVALGAWRVMFRELWDYRELVKRLIYRNIAGQVRQSFLGYVWISFRPDHLMAG